MKRQWMITALTVLVCTSSAVAGLSPKHRVTLADGDGGEVEAITLSPNEGPLSHHGGAVMATPRILAVFAGDSWKSEKNAALADVVLGQLRSLGGRSEYSSLSGYGVDSTAMTVSSIRIGMDRDDLSDLDIQRALEGASAQMSGVDANTIVVVVLAPELRSHLEDARANADYAAYHSHRQIGEGDIRYAVISAATTPQQLPGVIARTVRRTILNPEGDGWY
jgi:hypothetical protein